jgi:hypothetical protein
MGPPGRAVAEAVAEAVRCFVPERAAAASPVSPGSPVVEDDLPTAMVVDEVPPRSG